MGCDREEESRFEKLKLRRPRLYRNIMRMTNNGVTFEDAYNHTFSPSLSYKSKEYKENMHLQGMKDLEGDNVLCRNIL